MLLTFEAAAGQTDHAIQIASLIDPAKLATLGECGVNPRVQKAVYLLATARTQGQKPAKVLDSAVALAGYSNLASAKLTKDALLRSVPCTIVSPLSGTQSVHSAGHVGM